MNEGKVEFSELLTVPTFKDAVEAAKDADSEEMRFLMWNLNKISGRNSAKLLLELMDANGADGDQLDQIVELRKLSIVPDNV